MFVRVCVDIDAAGNVAGASLERHNNDGFTRGIIALEPPGPFETPLEAFERARAAALEAWGEQQSLLPG